MTRKVGSLEKVGRGLAQTDTTEQRDWVVGANLGRGRNVNFRRLMIIIKDTQVTSVIPHDIPHTTYHIPHTTYHIPHTT